MAYADSMRIAAPTVEIIAGLIDGVTGASGAIAASTAYTVTHGGFSVNPTYVAQYWKLGKIVIFCYESTISGTSNATTYTVSAPFTARTITNMVWRTRLSYVYDNGGYVSYAGIASIPSAGTTITLLKDQDGTTLWTNSGVKKASFTLIYEAV